MFDVVSITDRYKKSFGSITLLNLKAIFSVGGQRNKLLSIKSGTPPLKFERICLRFLRSRGWAVVSTDYLSDPLVEKNKKLVRLTFVHQGTLGSISRQYDWSLLRSQSSVPIVAISYDEPYPQTVQFASELRIHLLCYKDLSKFDEVLNAPALQTLIAH